MNSLAAFPMACACQIHAEYDGTRVCNNLSKKLSVVFKVKLGQSYLLLVGVTPLNSKLNGPALFIVLYRPVVVNWPETSREEVIVMWFYN